MTITITGRIADRDGLIDWRNAYTGDLDPVRAPAHEYRHRQQEALVKLHHRGLSVGQLVHLERDERNLTAVCVVDLDRYGDEDPDISGPLYFSPGITGRTENRVMRDIQIQELSLTDKPASIGLPPVTIIAGDITRPSDRSSWPIGWNGNLLLRHAAQRPRYSTGTLTIQDPDPIRIAGGWITRDGFVPSTQHRSLRPTPPPSRRANVVADIPGRAFGADLGQARLNPNKCVLMYGREPVGVRVAIDHPTLTLFKATRTSHAAEALELVHDGLLATAKPIVSNDGTVRTVALTAGDTDR